MPSHVLSARLTPKQFHAVEAIAMSRGITVSDVVRHGAMALGAAGPQGPDKLLKDLLAALDIDPASVTAEDAIAAIAPLVIALWEVDPNAPPPALPKDSAPALADAADAPSLQPTKALSKAELDYCKREGITTAELSARKAGAVRKPSATPASAQPAATVRAPYAPSSITPAERVACSKLGLTEAEYLEARRTAVRRS